MPIVARLGSGSDHGGVIISASETTFCDGIGIARQGDMHQCPIEDHGTTPIVSGSPSTFVDGRPMARVGDTASCGAVITDGCDVTFADGG